MRGCSCAVEVTNNFSLGQLLVCILILFETWQNEFETSYRQLQLFELIPDGGSK